MQDKLKRIGSTATVSGSSAYREQLLQSGAATAQSKFDSAYSAYQAGQTNTFSVANMKTNAADYRFFTTKQRVTPAGSTSTYQNMQVILREVK